MTPNGRSAAIRRNTVLLAAGQGLAQVTSSVLLIVGSIGAAEITGNDAFVGVVWGAYFVASALGSFGFGRMMDRLGRRPGLAVSYLLLAVAGAVCALGAAVASFPVLLGGTIVFGAAFGGANLARGAVADMYDPAHRARAVGVVLAVGTVGAVGGPFLVAFVRSWAERGGQDPGVLPWLIVPLVAVTAFACAVSLRPDPRDLAAGSDTSRSFELVRPPNRLLAIPMFRVAVLAAAVGQMAMVAVMGVTPVELHHVGASTTVISTVISLHVAGMWAFSPLIGAALDRFGRRPGLLAGGLTSIVGCGLAVSDAGAWGVGAGLFAIGLGWSATFLGATAVISDLTEPRERGAALGFNDLLVSLSSAVAGLAGGFVLEGTGFRVVGLVAAGLVLAVVITMIRVRRPADVVPVER